MSSGVSALGLLVGTVAVMLLVRGRVRTSSTSKEMPNAARCITSGPLALEIDALRFTAFGVAVAVTPKQADMLYVMLTHPGRVFSDRDLLERVWDGSPYASSSDVKQQIYLIRKRIRNVGLPASDILVTVPGMGYKLVGSPVDPAVDAGSTDDTALRH